MNTQTSITLRNFLRKQLSGELLGGVCFFRRFGALTNVTSHSGIKMYNSPNEFTLHSTILNSKAYEQYGEITCSSFTGITQSNKMRDFEPIQVRDKAIHLKSQNYAYLDMISNFDLRPAFTHLHVPKATDLIFVFVKHENLTSLTSQNIIPVADLWCIVSDQFFHAYISIMCDGDESQNKLVPKSVKNSVERDRVLRKKMFKGNYLRTNSLKNEELVRDSNFGMISLTREEYHAKFWHLRSEVASKSWCDVYACLVLLSKYGELPDSSNVPTHEGKIQREWDLPYNFVANLYNKVDLVLPHEECPATPITSPIKYPIVGPVVKKVEEEVAKPPSKKRAFDLVFEAEW